MEGWGRPCAEAAWAKWGGFSAHGVKLHLVCSANRVPLSYEMTAANKADVLLVEELLAEARLGDGATRRPFGDLPYRSAKLAEGLAKDGVLPAAERADRRPGVRQQVQIAFASLRAVCTTTVWGVSGNRSRSRSRVCPRE